MNKGLSQVGHISEKFVEEEQKLEKGERFSGPALVAILLLEQETDANLR
jgi:hypothetical protein